VSVPRYDRTLILASIIFALLIAATPDTLAQDATFNERYPTKQTPAQGAPEQVSRPALEATPRIAEECNQIRYLDPKTSPLHEIGASPRSLATEPG
jgi:hypothetical protein